MRYQALKQLKEQVFLQHSPSDDSAKFSVYDSCLATTKVEQNISSMRERISATIPVAGSGSQLVTFSGKLASPEQTKDLLNF